MVFAPVSDNAGGFELFLRITKASPVPAPPPAIVIVLVAPVPDATTPDPTKLSVVPEVDREEPSS